MLIKKIKNLEIQGAKEIAVASLNYLKKFALRYGFGKKFDNICKKLEDARPTAVVLHNCLEIIKKSKNIETIDRLLTELESATDMIAENGEHLIRSGYRIHTHCHSSEALAVIKKAAEKKRFTVVVDETRPRYQGIKTAKELAKIKNISVVLITDDAASLTLTSPVLPKDDIVIVGCDAMRREGVINKIGTYFLALAAFENKIPFYVAGSSFKIDRRRKIEIEMRPPSEVYRKIKGVKIINPAFDITPWKFVTGVITEKGVLKPNEILGLITRK